MSCVDKTSRAVLCPRLNDRVAATSLRTTVLYHIETDINQLTSISQGQVFKYDSLMYDRLC